MNRALKKFWKSWPVIVLVLISLMIMMPRLFKPEFGLLDDGVTISISRKLVPALKVLDFRVLLELENTRGRFRPVYWLAFIIQYYLWGQNPSGYFIVQWLCLLLTSMAIFWIVESSTRDRLSGFFSGILFLLSPAVIEAYYTLSKPEPIFVLLLCLSIFGVLQAYKKKTSLPRILWFIFSGLFLLLAYFTKETVVVMVFVSGFLAAISLVLNDKNIHITDIRKTLWLYFLMNIIFAGLYWVMRSFSGTAEIITGNDSGNYLITFGNIANSLMDHSFWYVRDFSLLAPVVISVFLAYRKKNHRNSVPEWVLISGTAWLLGWMIIMLPWHALLEYYLLPSAFVIAMISGVWFRSVLTGDDNFPINRFSWLLILLFVFMVLISRLNGSSNGLIQLTIDEANGDLVQFLSEIVPENGVIFVNLPAPNEYVFEIQLHLHEFYERTDIQVKYFDRFDPGKDEAVFLVTPVMENQPFPTVRVAMSEMGAEEWKFDLVELIGEDGTVIYRQTASTEQTFFAIEKSLCVFLDRQRRQNEVFCWFDRPLIDTRTFNYGWEVYQYLEE